MNRGFIRHAKTYLSGLDLRLRSFYVGEKIFVHLLLNPLPELLVVFRILLEALFL